MSAQANSDGPSVPPVRDSLTPRLAAGPGARSVGQWLTVTAAPTSHPYFPVCHLSRGSAAHSVGPVNCVDLRWPPRRVALHPRRTARPGAHSVGQGLTVMAAPTSDLRIPPVCHWSPGVGRPQCRPRANCGGCALSPTVAHSTHAGPRGRAPTESARANCDGCAYLRLAFPQCVIALRGRAPTVLAPANCVGCAYLPPVHPHTFAASAPHRQWACGSGGLLDWSRVAPRRLAHLRLEQSISKPSNPLSARVAVPNRFGF